MSGEKLKVLELVSDGKITPEEGVRLIEALGEADRKAGGSPSSSAASGFGGQKFNPFNMGEVKIPKIDLGNLGEVLVEVKNNVMDLGKKAEAGFRRSRASRFFEMNDYPVSVPRHEGLGAALLRLNASAGKLKVKAAEAGGEELLSGSLKRSPDEPEVKSEVRDGRIEARIASSIGRASYALNPDVSYSLRVGNAAADARLELAGLLVEELDVDNNAGNISIELGDRAAQLRVKLENNAGSVRLAVPAHYAIRIKSSGSLSSHNCEKYGLELNDGQAQSGDWGENPRAVDITLNQNVASFTLDWQRRDGVSVGYNPAGSGANSNGEWRDED